MGKKQLRISDPVLIRKRMGEFLNSRIQVVLTDNTVFFGALKKVEGNTILLSNMRLKDMKLTFDQVQEFYVDLDA